MVFKLDHVAPERDGVGRCRWNKLRDYFFAMITESDREIRMSMFDKLIEKMAEHPLSIPRSQRKREA
jgi:hypothetical protein